MIQGKISLWKLCYLAPKTLFLVALILTCIVPSHPEEALPQKKVQVDSFQAHNAPITAIAFSPDRSLLATADNKGLIKVWVTQSNQLFHIFRGHTDSVKTLTFSADSNTLVSGSSDKSVRFWSIEIAKFKESHQFADGVSHVIFSPDGQKLAAAILDGSLVVWNFPQGDKNILKAHRTPVQELVWSADSQTLRTIDNYSFDPPYFWNTTGGVLKALPLKPRLPMHHTLFSEPRVLSPDQKFFVTLDATSYAITSLRVRDWPTLTARLRVLPTTDQRVGHPNCLAFSPDGQSILSGSSDGKVYRWDMSWLDELQQDQSDGADTSLNTLLNLNQPRQREFEDVSFWGRELIPGVNDGSVIGAGGNIPKPTHPKWPALKGPIHGSEMLSIENRSQKGVWIALRQLSDENRIKTGQGFDIYIPAGKTTKVGIYGDARFLGTTYDVYAIFDDDPKTLYRGDDLIIRHNANYTLTLSAGQGNYGMRKIF